MSLRPKEENQRTMSAIRNFLSRKLNRRIKFFTEHSASGGVLRQFVVSDEHHIIFDRKLHEVFIVGDTVVFRPRNKQVIEGLKNKLSLNKKRTS